MIVLAHEDLPKTGLKVHYDSRRIVALNPIIQNAKLVWTIPPCYHKKQVQAVNAVESHEARYEKTYRESPVHINWFGHVNVPAGEANG